MRISDAVEDFLASRTGSVSAATVENYHYALRPFVDGLGADMEVTAVTRRDVRQWRASLEETGRAVSTINNTIKTLRMFWSWLTDDLAADGVSLNDVTKELVLYRNESDGVRAISPLSIARMVRYAREQNDLRAVAMVLYLYSTGGRVGGLINLRMGQLDLDNGYANVKEKGAKWRMVFLDPLAVEALRNYITYQRPRTGPDYVFKTRLNGPFKKQSAWKLFTTLADRAGVPEDEPTNPHAFRHAFSRDYLLNGGDLSSLRDLLGHTNIKTTNDYYLHWSAGALREQHQKHSPLKSLPLE